ncbi:MAG: AMP-binding protein [Planctomycetota bacterium]|nr:AMP-binding protein [Planctomycetota bacterium]
MDPAAAPLLAALQDRGSRPFLARADGTVSGTAMLAAMDAARTRAAALPVALAPGDVVALRGRHGAIEIAAPLTAWSMGLCTHLISARETTSSVDGLLARSGARMLLTYESSGAFGGIPLAGTNTINLPTGTLLVTSGSRAAPKLVYHRLEKHIESARAAAAFLELGAEDRLLLSLPAWHVGGLSLVFRALVSGAVLCTPPPAMKLAEALATFRPTQVSLVATQLARLLEDVEAVAHLRACRTVLMGGGPTPESLRGAALDAGIPLAMGYGATETGAFVAASRDPAIVRRDDAVGPALPGREVLVDGSGRIAVRAPTLLDGYLGRTGLETALDASGAWPSGDLGTLQGGVLHVHGRADRVFISGGENVQPEEIEDALLGLAGVTEAVVVPVPDVEFGQRPVAFVAGEGLSAPTLDAGLRAELAGFKTPDIYYQLPARPAGQLKPDLLRLTAMARDALAAAQLRRL